MSEQDMKKNEQGNEHAAPQTVNVSIDTDALAKSMGESMKSVLTDMMKKENASPEVVAEACTAVISGELAKMKKGIEEQLQAAAADIQKAVDEKVAEIEKSKMDKSEDEYIAINGVAFKKSEVGAGAFAALKASYMQQEAIRKELEQQKLEARVEKEFPNVAGTPAEKAAFLGYIEKADAPITEIGLKLLKALDGMGAEYSKETGSTSGGSDHVQKMGPGDTDASMKLEKLAQQYAEKNNVPLPSAYAAILKTDEGEKLYNEHRGD